MAWSLPGLPWRSPSSLVTGMLLLTAACGGGGTQSAAPGAPPAPQPAAAEQTLADLFNLTALYQRMGRLAGGSPLPFVGSTAFFAGRGDSTVVLLGISLDNRGLSFQRSARQFAARYRVELTLQRENAPPLRYAREETVTVGSYLETQRADESVVFQQALLLPPGSYQTTLVVRDANSTSTSRAEATLVVPAFPAGSFSAPVFVYASSPRADLWTEPTVLLNPRGTVSHGGNSLRIVIEGYGLTDIKHRTKVLVYPRHPQS